MKENADKKTTDNSAGLTDAMLELRASEWENDTWDGHLTEIAVGRPRIMGEELVNVTFRLPKSRLDIIAEIAKRTGKTRSEYLREAVDKALVVDTK